MWNYNSKFPSSKTRLHAFGGIPIKVIGEIKLSCRRQGKRYGIMFQVVEGDHLPLLSAKASQELGLVKFCNSLTVKESEMSSEELLNRYRVKAQEFSENYDKLFSGYGKFEGKVSLEVDESVAPSIQPPRRVPIALRDKLKAELVSLEKGGIITKEESHTDWVSNIVIIQKGDPEKKSIRVCLDPILLRYRNIEEAIKYV